MRPSRLLVAVLALALLGLVPAFASSSATAAAPVRSAAAAPDPTKLTAKIIKRKNGTLAMTGIIRPKKGPVTIYKATTCVKKGERKGECNFKKFRKSKVNKKGRYTTRVYAPRKGSWAWVAIKGGVASEVWVTCVKRPNENCKNP